MQDKCFLDSNLLIYYSSDKGEKLSVVQNLLLNEEEKIISLQTLNEFANVCFKKGLLDSIEILKATQAFLKTFYVTFQQAETIKNAIEIKARYKYSYYDSLVIATALEANCKILYSEDLHHGQLIDKKLKIINPFL